MYNIIQRYQNILYLIKSYVLVVSYLNSKIGYFTTIFTSKVVKYIQKWIDNHLHLIKFKNPNQNNYFNIFKTSIANKNQSKYLLVS